MIGTIPILALVLFLVIAILGWMIVAGGLNLTVIYTVVRSWVRSWR